MFKNLIFAKRTLEQNEYEKYEEIYKILTRDMPAPNIIVYLYASQETLMKRIALRGREFEKNMDPAYLTQLANDYEMFINIFEEANPHIPVLRFNGDHLDFVNKKEDMEYVLTSIVEVIQGVQER